MRCSCTLATVLCLLSLAGCDSPAIQQATVDVPATKQVAPAAIATRDPLNYTHLDLPKVMRDQQARIDASGPNHFAKQTLFIGKIQEIRALQSGDTVVGIDADGLPSMVVVLHILDSMAGEDDRLLPSKTIAIPVEVDRLDIWRHWLAEDRELIFEHNRLSKSEIVFKHGC